MNREKTLKIVLAVVGLFFVAGMYPVVMYLWHPGNEPPGDAMRLSLYVALGVFLLLAVPNPPAHRSLIAYAAWGNFAHGAVMAVLALRVEGDPDFWPGAALAGIIGAALLVLVPAPPKQATEQAWQRTALGSSE